MTLASSVSQPNRILETPSLGDTASARMLPIMSSGQMNAKGKQNDSGRYTAKLLLSKTSCLLYVKRAIARLKMTYKYNGVQRQRRHIYMVSGKQQLQIADKLVREGYSAPR